jgi:gamma-glutamyltranspeptidase/glutathione hydrolase
MGVSLIQSNYSGIGSGISAGDFGVWLHNRGAGFSLLPGHPNEAAPGKRPLHTLAPTLWTTDGGDLSLLLGTQGGHQQPQYLSQMAALLLHAGLEPADAQRFPRWHIGGDDPADPSHVSVEAGLPDAVATALTARGHHLEEVATWQPYWGPVSTIAIDADGTRRGAADPRVSTATAVG